MQPLNPSLDDIFKSSKDRLFGEYQYKPGLHCPCYQGRPDGPPQYEPGDVYFCFSKFQNPFYKNWVGRYAAMAIFFPTLDVLHEAERRLGRPSPPPEWLSLEGVLTTRPIKTTVRGQLVLAKKAEAWLKGNMIDELDHRLLNVESPQEWKVKERELSALYGKYPWAILHKGETDWNHLSAATNVLEMLRQTDYVFAVLPPKYEEPAKEGETTAAREKKTKTAAGAIAELESIETVAEPQELL